MRDAALAAVIALGLAGCTPPAAPDAMNCADIHGDPAVTVQLLFGRSLRAGGTVSDTDWRDFLARSVTPRFPDGLTVLEGSGQWRQQSTGKIIFEPSTVVEIASVASPDLFARLEAIRADYRTRFAQESVGLVVNRSCMSF